MRILGLDVGSKTVGVAVSDPLGVIATGVTTIERVGIRKDTGKVIGKNGKRVSVERHCTASYEKYNRVLCLDCIAALTVAEMEKVDWRPDHNA